MKADQTKNRVTVRYLLAEHFDMLGLFRRWCCGQRGSHPVSSGTTTGMTPEQARRVELTVVE